MKKTRISNLLKAAGIVSVCVLFSFTAANAKKIENPQASQVANIYRFLAGEPINFEEKARQSSEYYQADEFDKPQVLQQTIKRLRTEYQEAAEVDVIRLRTRGRFSDYDADLGAYKFELFKPGTYFPFRDGSSQFSLSMENAEDFRNWVLPVPDAKAIRNEAPYGEVVMEIDIRPFGVSRSNRNTIRGQIVGLKVNLQRNSRLVHEKTISPDQYKKIAGATNPETVNPVTADKHRLQGLQIGTNTAAFEEWAANAGYKTRGGGNEYRIATNDAAINYEFNASASFAAESSGSADADQWHYNVFGPRADCRTKSERLESCGRIRFNDADKLASALIMQTVKSMTKQQLVDRLIARYGSPDDTFDVTLMQRYRAQQLVWGLSSKSVESAFSLTNVSGDDHWQIEAVITQPEPDRFTVFVQINMIDPAKANSGGKVKF